MTESHSLNVLIALALVAVLAVAVLLVVDGVKKHRRGVGLAILDDRPPVEPGWTAPLLTDEERAALLASCGRNRDGAG